MDDVKVTPEAVTETVSAPKAKAKDKNVITLRLPSGLTAAQRSNIEIRIRDLEKRFRVKRE